MNVIIIDDEPSAINNLKLYIQKHTDWNIVNTFHNPYEAIVFLNDPNTKIDCMFLDINMGSISGFDLLSRVNKIDCDLVFVTAYDEYAIEAFRHNALDYLLKPIDEKELLRIFSKIKSTDSIKKTNHSPYYSIKINNKWTFISYHDIEYIEAKGSYSTIHFINKSERCDILISKPINILEEEFEKYGFFRSHKSILVNINHIVGIENHLSFKLAELKGKHKVLVSRRKYSELKELIKNNN